jgi:hypothetical protein
LDISPKWAIRNRGFATLLLPNILSALLLSDLEDYVNAGGGGIFLHPAQNVAVSSRWEASSTTLVLGLLAFLTRSSQTSSDTAATVVLSI